MTRHFYTDPLAAAWMWKQFQMEFTTFNGVLWRYDPDDGEPELHWQADEERERIYVHPESLPLMEPQVGDLCATRCGKHTGFVTCEGPLEDVWIALAVYPCHLMDGVYVKRTDILHIVQRNGIAFHCPESEAA